MKKFIFSFLLIFCLGFLSGCSNVDFNTKVKVAQIEKTIKSIPDKNLYEILTSNNPTKRKIKVHFMDLGAIGEAYSGFDALGWEQDNKFYIFINDKHKDAPVEALTALVVGRLHHLDTEDSVNEEIFAMLSEAYIWEYLLRQNPEISKIEHPLVKREIMINKALKKDNYNENLIKKLIITNPHYNNLEKTSPGFSDDELATKIKNLKEVFAFN